MDFRRPQRSNFKELWKVVNRRVILRKNPIVVVGKQNYTLGAVSLEKRYNE
jgi:hypothetical protein